MTITYPSSPEESVPAPEPLFCFKIASGSRSDLSSSSEIQFRFHAFAQASSQLEPSGSETALGSFIGTNTQTIDISVFILWSGRQTVLPAEHTQYQNPKLSRPQVSITAQCKFTVRNLFTRACPEPSDGIWLGQDSGSCQRHVSIEKWRECWR